VSQGNVQSCLVAARNGSWLPGLIGLTLIGISILPTSAQTSHSDNLKLNGGSYALNIDRSKILFSIGHFFVSSTQGQFTAFDGKLNFESQAAEHGTVTIHVSPGSISTGNGARDEHLRTSDFFDVDKFPLITFESTDLVKTSSSTGKLTGKLFLHGITKPITLIATLRTPDSNADRLNFSVAGTVKRSDYGMNNYMGVIGDYVTLTIDAEFDRER
jgi:polyisoprenoid-binding protein YceI